MNIFETFLLVAHVMVAIGICGFVLLQHGKGADMGAAFGSGSSGSVFGSSGSANFLSRTTAVLAAAFFLSSLGLTWYASTRAAPRSSVQQGVMDRLPPSKAADIPSTPATATPAAGAPVPSGGAEAGKSVAPADPASKAGEVPK